MKNKSSSKKLNFMGILNIHGYDGSPHNAAYAALQANNCTDITAPAIDYDAESPENILGKLRYIIADKRIELIVGTSLGGFYAAVLSAERNLPVVLVSPCPLPFLHLPRLGFNGNIKPFVSMFGTLAKLDINNVSCIVSGQDEIIDTHDFTERFLHNARFRIVPDGKHSGYTLPLKAFFSEMLQYYMAILPLKERAECISSDLSD